MNNSDQQINSDVLDDTFSKYKKVFSSSFRMINPTLKCPRKNNRTRWLSNPIHKIQMTNCLTLWTKEIKISKNQQMETNNLTIFQEKKSLKLSIKMEKCKQITRCKLNKKAKNFWLTMTYKMKSNFTSLKYISFINTNY